LIAGISDAVVIGSRIIQLIEASDGNAPLALTQVHAFIQGVRLSMDQQSI